MVITDIAKGIGLFVLALLVVVPYYFSSALFPRIYYRIHPENYIHCLGCAKFRDEPLLGFSEKQKEKALAAFSRIVSLPSLAYSGSVRSVLGLNLIECVHDCGYTPGLVDADKGFFHSSWLEKISIDASGGEVSIYPSDNVCITLDDLDKITGTTSETLIGPDRGPLNFGRLTAYQYSLRSPSGVYRYIYPSYYDAGGRYGACFKEITIQNHPLDPRSLL